MSIIKRFIPKNASKIPYLSMVILAAGSSTRMGFDKITADLCGKPVILHTLEAFHDLDFVQEIVVVTREESVAGISDLVHDAQLNKVSCVVNGGNTRAESSYIGVFHCNEKAKFIGIHDGARPIVSRELVERVALGAKKYTACCPGNMPTDTIKELNDEDFVIRTIPRSNTVCIQTPQIFKSEVIKAALTKAVNDKWTITDDASAVEQLGIPVFIEEGSYENIKLTQPLDYYLAEKILNERD